MWDDHLKWIPVKETQNQDRRNDSITTDTRTAMIGCHEADTGEEGEQEEIDEALVGQRQGEWQEVSQHAKTDLEMFSHEQGFGAGSLLLNLNAALRDKYDYGEFLRKFAVLGEEMHVNDDEFDYIYYTYGMTICLWWNRWNTGRTSVSGNLSLQSIHRDPVREKQWSGFCGKLIPS